VQYEFKASFDRRFKKLSSSRQTKAYKAIDTLMKYLDGQAPLPPGLGLKNEQNRRNSELFRGVCPPPAEGIGQSRRSASGVDGLKSQIRRLSDGLRGQNVKLFLREP